MTCKTCCGLQMQVTCTYAATRPWPQAEEPQLSEYNLYDRKRPGPRLAVDHTVGALSQCNSVAYFGSDPATVTSYMVCSSITVFSAFVRLTLQAYLLYNPRSRRVHTSKAVTFEETRFIGADSPLARRHIREGRCQVCSPTLPPPVNSCMSTIRYSRSTTNHPTAPQQQLHVDQSPDLPAQPNNEPAVIAAEDIE